MGDDDPREDDSRKGDPRDEFEGLTFDEDFIRGAAHHEPAARTRDAIARYAHLSADHVSQPKRETGRPERTGDRNWAGTVVIVIVIATFLAGGIAFFHHSKASGHPGGAKTSGGAKTTELDQEHYQPGDCYVWDQAARETFATQVSCSKPHLFEALSTLSIGSLLGSAYPGVSGWHRMETIKCLPEARAFLGHGIAAGGRYTLTLIDPTDLGWQMGGRRVVCGLAANVLPVVGAANSRYPLFLSQIKGASQKWTWKPGICLRFGGHYGTEQIACSRPHDAEALGGATLHGGAAEPTRATMIAQLMPQCRADARTTLGHTLGSSRSRLLTWSPLDSQSWNDGLHTVNCMLRTHLPQPARTSAPIVST